MLMPNYLLRYSTNIAPHPQRQIMAAYDWIIPTDKRAKMVPRAIILGIPRSTHLAIKSTSFLKYDN